MQIKSAFLLFCASWHSTAAESNIFDPEDALFWERTLGGSGSSRRMLRQRHKEVQDDGFFWERELGGSHSHHRKLEQEQNGFFWERELGSSHSHHRKLEQERNSFFWNRELGTSHSHRRTLEREQREIQEDTQFWRGGRETRSHNSKHATPVGNDVDVKQYVNESPNKPSRSQEPELMTDPMNQKNVEKSLKTKSANSDEISIRQKPATIEDSFWELFGAEVLEIRQKQRPHRMKLRLS